MKRMRFISVVAILVMAIGVLGSGGRVEAQGENPPSGEAGGGRD